jgi:hypothetical protein
LTNPNDVKLRAGAAVAENVKLYKWEEVGAKDVVVTDSGVGVEVPLVDKVILVTDAGSGAEAVLKLVLKNVTVKDSGSASEDIGLTKALVQAKELLSELELYLIPYQKIRNFSTELKLFNVTVEEEILGSGVPAKMVSASADNVDVLNTTGEAYVKDIPTLTPRLGSVQKIPKGYLQGHRSRTVTIYVLGRNTAFDKYLDEDGDSKPIYELRLNCLDKDGNPTTFYIYHATPISADVTLIDREDVIYAYRFNAGEVYEKPHIGLVKLTAKPIAVPLSIIFTHPEIHQLSSFYEEFWSPQIEIIQPSSELEAGVGVTDEVNQLETVLEVTTEE